jgi:cytochrome c556
MRFLSSAVLVTLALGGVCAAVSAQAPAPVTIEQHEAAMKQIAQANGAMQKLIKANDLAAAGKEAQTLVTQFTLVERFWTQNKKDDAIKLAMTARTGATDVVAATGAADQMKAQMAAQNLGGTCKQCHGTYREGDAATGYRIKADAGVK